MRAVLSRLVREYGESRRKLPASAMLPLSQMINASRMPQDGEERVLRVLLELVPTFAQAVEVAITHNKKTRFQATTTQTLIMAAKEGPLQHTVNAHQRVEFLPDCSRQLVVSQASATVFLLLNHADAVAVQYGPCVLANAVYTPTGFLLLRKGHYTALVETVVGWFLCDDLRASCEPVANASVFLARIDPSAVRLVVLVRQDVGVSHGPRPVNLTNVGNSCALSAVLQLLMHSRSGFLDALNGQQALSIPGDLAAECALARPQTRQ